MGEHTICLIHCFLAFCQVNLLVFMLPVSSGIGEAKSLFSEIHSYPTAVRAIFGKAYIVILSQLSIMNVVWQLHDQMHRMLVLPIELRHAFSFAQPFVLETTSGYLLKVEAVLLIRRHPTPS